MIRFGLSLSPALVPFGIAAPVQPPAATSAFTMTQLADSKRVYQRDTATGGGQAKGTGSIPIPVTVTALGTPQFRIRASDGTTILQDATTLPAFTALGAQTLSVTGVDARLGWFFVDLGDGATWQLGTTLVGMGALIIINGQSLVSRMLTAASDNISMTAAGVTPDPNTSVYALPGDGTGAQTVLAWKSWDATTASSGGATPNSAGGAAMAKTLVSQLGVNVGTIGRPLGGTPIYDHTMPGPNGMNIRNLILATGGFELAFLMIGHSNSAGLAGYLTDAMGARDFKGQLSAHFQLLTAANPRGSNYRSVVWAIPNCDPSSWGSDARKNMIRRAMYEFATSPTASALMTSCKYVNNYSITMSGDNIHENQAGSIQIANVVTTAFSTGLDAPAGDQALTPTPISTGTATNATYTTAGKFTAASLDGGYVITSSPYAGGGVASVGFWYRGTPAANSVAFSWGNQYLQVNGTRWKWHETNGTETTASTGPVIGTDTTTWHYLSIDRVPASPDGSGGYLRVYQDGVMILNLPAASAGTSTYQSDSAIRTFSGSAGGFMMNIPISEWRGYTKAMGNTVPTAALSASDPFLFIAFPLNGNATTLA